jgi:hypothetical protein
MVRGLTTRRGRPPVRRSTAVTTGVPRTRIRLFQQRPAARHDPAVGRAASDM